MEEILKYFCTLSEVQKQQFTDLQRLYEEWNAKINVISRKDIGNLYIHHVLHSLAIAKLQNFKDETTFLDFGTGGGFPGIPLAIMFPQCKFKLIDGTGKKIKVVEEISKSLNLTNITAQQLRGEDEKGKYDYVISRGVMPLIDLVKIVSKNISHNHKNALPNGIICLKGGDIQQEVKAFRNIIDISPIEKWFEEEWFNKKYVLYLPV